MRNLDMSLWDCFKNIMTLVKLADYSVRFYIDLGLGYILTFVAGFSFIKKKM